MAHYSRFVWLIGVILTGGCAARSSLELGSSDAGGAGGVASETTSGPSVATGQNAATASTSGEGPGSSGSGESAVSTVAASSSSGSPADLGCADGTREAYAFPMYYPDIAGCAGGFRIPGVGCPEPPACNRQGGNDGPIPQGQGCNVEDLCAEGWHVCLSAVEVKSHAVNGCFGASDMPASSFFVTRQSGPNNLDCAACGGNACLPSCQGTAELTTNGIFGCGTIGTPSNPATCGVLDETTSDLCKDLPPSWRCGTDSSAELLNVVHREPYQGGALCCRD